MAKNPRVQDPADAALSAIEEALSLGAPASGNGARDKLPDVDDGFSLDLDHDSRADAEAPRLSQERQSGIGVRRPPANDTAKASASSSTNCSSGPRLRSTGRPSCSRWCGSAPAPR